jgi:hypothetical protein
MCVLLVDQAEAATLTRGAMPPRLQLHSPTIYKPGSDNDCVGGWQGRSAGTRTAAGKAVWASK